MKTMTIYSIPKLGKHPNSHFIAQVPFLVHSRIPLLILYYGFVRLYYAKMVAERKRLSPFQCLVYSGANYSPNRTNVELHSNGSQKTLTLVARNPLSISLQSDCARRAAAMIRQPTLAKSKQNSLASPDGASPSRLCHSARPMALSC